MAQIGFLPTKCQLIRSTVKCSLLCRCPRPERVPPDQSEAYGKRPQRINSDHLPRYHNEPCVQTGRQPTYRSSRKKWAERTGYQPNGPTPGARKPGPSGVRWLLPFGTTRKTGHGFSSNQGPSQNKNSILTPMAPSVASFSIHKSVVLAAKAVSAGCVPKRVVLK